MRSTQSDTEADQDRAGRRLEGWVAMVFELRPPLNRSEGAGHAPALFHVLESRPEISVPTAQDLADGMTGAGDVANSPLYRRFCNAA
jgi:hypothetical protein